MVALTSFQVQNKTPKASHGMGSTVKCARFQVTLPATSNGDTIDFGKLPSYAVPVHAMLLASNGATATLNVGTANSAAGFFSAVTLVADTPLRTALSTLLGKVVPLGGVEVLGAVTGSGLAGTLQLFIEYTVEDAGVAYPAIAFP